MKADKFTVMLPKQEYIREEKDGRIITYCTLRQKALHTVGLDYANGRMLYTRHEKRFYKPYRNYFSGKDGSLEKLVAAGYMERFGEDTYPESVTYFFNRAGLDWLGEQLGIYIYNCGKGK